MSSNGSTARAAPPRDVTEVVRTSLYAGIEDEVERRVAAKVARAVPFSKALADIVRLLADLTEEHVALKRFVVENCLTNGGTWKRETHYKPNEQVTSDGTLWLCLQPNVDSKPPGDCWRQLHRTIGRK